MLPPQMMHVSSQPGQMAEGATHSLIPQMMNVSSQPVAFPPVMYMPQPDENFFFQNQQLLQNPMAFQMTQVNNQAPVQVNNAAPVETTTAQSPETPAQTPVQTEGQPVEIQNEMKRDPYSTVPQMQVPQIQPAQFVQPMVFPQVPMTQQQIPGMSPGISPQFVPCVVPGAPFQPAAFQPMMFVPQQNVILINQSNIQLCDPILLTADMNLMTVVNFLI